MLQRTGSDRQQEVMACEWSVNHLRDEMRYIREVSRDGEDNDEADPSLGV